MDDDTKENPPKDFNKLDLSQLQGFSFGTQWTQDKSSPSDSRDRPERPRRDYGPDRRDGGGAPERRDRRVFRKPAGREGAAGPAGAPPAGGSGGAGEAPPRREYSGDGGPRREFRGGERGGPRQGGYGGRAEMPERGPYESPFFNVAFYPEDTSFNALAKTIRTSCRTIELFEIARTVVAKPDRFVVVLTRRTPMPGGGSSEAQPAAETPPAKQPIYLSVPDGLPFESEEAAVAHVLANHLDRFFDLAEVEIDPPKGNFLVINKCGVTGELLGPPNYHRYAQIVQQHFAAKISRMPLEAFRSRIETVRDPEVVAQWLAKMKKTTRYTWKQYTKPVAAPVAVAPEPAAPVATDAVPAEAAPQEGAPVPPPAAEPAPESPPALAFDAFEDARTHLLTHAREKIVRTVESARFHGKLLETMPPGEIRRALEGALERQRRFPLDTANALRGRLRREHFTIFKKGSKGVSYVCAVKRKFRVPGQSFSESISTLIAYIEAHPMARASELATKFLGIELPAPPKAAAPAEQPANPPGEESVTAPTSPAPAAEPVLTLEQRAKLNRMQGDLRWLVTEGYVTEFIDGRLFAPPPMVEARKKEVEAEENDPENFPEAPASTPPFEAAPAPAETKPAAAVPEAPAATESAPTAEIETPAPTAEPTVTPGEPPAASNTQAHVETESALVAEPPVATPETVFTAEPATVTTEAPPPTSEPAVAPVEPPASVDIQTPVEPEPALVTVPAEPEAKTETPPPATPAL